MIATDSPRRCLLFVPGARPERFDKAVASGADQVCIDLEDAVGRDDKVTAREATLQFILATQNKSAPTSQSAQSRPPVQLGLRINSISGLDHDSRALGLADLQRIVETGARPAFIMLPKIEDAEDVLRVEKILAHTDIPVIPQLESPHAIFEARAIAGACKRVQALMFGGYDYAVAARVKPGERGWFWARAQLAAAAAEAEIGALDVPSLELKNMHEVAAETEQVIALGYTGKAAIHPSQVATIQNIFLPTADEHQRALRVLAAVASATSAAIQVDGKLVDRPIVLAAQRVAELARLGLRG